MPEKGHRLQLPACPMPLSMTLFVLDAWGDVLYSSVPATALPYYILCHVKSGTAYRCRRAGSTSVVDHR